MFEMSRQCVDPGASALQTPTVRGRARLWPDECMTSNNGTSSNGSSSFATRSRATLKAASAWRRKERQRNKGIVCPGGANQSLTERLHGSVTMLALPTLQTLTPRVATYTKRTAGLSEHKVWLKPDDTVIEKACGAVQELAGA